MTTTPTGAASTVTPPRAAVDHDGIAPVPEAERTSTPGDFGWIWPSAQFSFGTVVLGALPVVFGLGWWASASAIAAGVAVGTALLAPLARFGVRTGTNDPVASGAHFGVRGRVVGNTITVVTALGFFAIAVWTGGTAVMVAGHRLFSTPTGPGALTVAMFVTAAAVALVAVRGHETLVRTYRITAVTGGAVLLGTALVLAPKFDAGYAGGPWRSTAPCTPGCSRRPRPRPCPCRTPRSRATTPATCPLPPPPDGWCGRAGSRCSSAVSPRCSPART